MRARWPDFLPQSLSRMFPSILPGCRSIPIAIHERAFRPWPPGLNCFDRTPGQARRPGVYLTSSNDAPYRRSRSESLALARTDVPALTVTANAGHVSVAGVARQDWLLRLCAYGDGNSAAEALDRSRLFSLTRVGSTVSLDAARFSPREAGGELIVEGPPDAPITVHASFAAVQVCDRSGPVHVAAIHARARILNTTGRVQASGFIVDFAGSQGDVTLSAEAEIDLNFTRARFDGALTAWAQRPLRVLVPRGFQSAFQATVNHPADFICRTVFRERITHQRRGSLHVFTYPGDGTTSPESIHLRSEHGAIVMDDTVLGRQSLKEFRQRSFEDYT